MKCCIGLELGRNRERMRERERERERERVQTDEVSKIWPRYT